jgi:hypothetical protein
MENEHTKTSVRKMNGRINELVVMNNTLVLSLQNANKKLNDLEKTVTTMNSKISELDETLLLFKTKLEDMDS